MNTVNLKHIMCAAAAMSLFGNEACVSHGGYQYSPQGYNQNYPQGYSAPSRGRAYSRGQRLPDQYRQAPYVVGDWRQRNLRAPPNGYGWYRDDAGQFLLAAIATGIILEIIAQSQYRDYP
jgi:Ni/Co efflux regulator RcnB